MRDDLGIRILDCAEDAVGHSLAVELHVGMDGGDHDVELRQDFVTEIERAIFKISTSMPASRRIPGTRS